MSIIQEVLPMLFGGGVGVVTGLISNVTGFFKAKQEHEQELAMIKINAEIAATQFGQKMQTLAVESVSEQSSAVYKHDSALMLNASKWIINLSASVRPIMTYVFLAAKFFVMYSILTLSIDAGLTLAEASVAVWDDSTEATFKSIVSFWFVDRSMVKKAASGRR